MNKMLFGYNFGKLSVAIIPIRQEKADKRDWSEINPETLAPRIRDSYNEYKRLYKAMKAAKEGFENAMRQEAGIAIERKAPATVGKKALSLADYLEQQANR